MTFLYEQDVLKSLASALSKEAQQAPAGPIGNEIQVAKKLVARLAREAGGGAEAPNVSSDAPGGAGLNTGNLQNIGNLLKFLDDNQIKVDGVRVSFDQAESEKLPEGEQAKLSPVTINVSRDAASRKWNTADYYVNLPTLIKYVSYLQNKAKQEDNKVLSVLVGKLIDQVNTVKPDSGLSRTPKSVPGKVVNELPDDTQLDGFGNKLFDSKTLTSDVGGHPLYAKDLKSRESLNAWMLLGPEAQIITYDDKGKKLAAVKYSDEKADRCVIINTLYNRARNLLQAKATSPEDTKKYNYYIKKIQEIGQTFTGPDGQACSVSGAYVGKPGHAAGDTELAGYKTQEEKDQATSGAGSNTVAAIGRIISSLPLSIEDVNLDRIFSFTRELNTLIGGSQGGEAADRNNRIRGYINDLGQKMIALKGLTKHNAAIFPMNISAPEFQSMLKNPANYLPALEGLSTVINLVRMIVAEFYSAYRIQITGMSDQYKQLLRGQIGTNRDDSSIYARNIEDINYLKNKYSQVLRVR